MLGLIKHNVQLFLTKIFYSFKKRDNKIWVFGEWFGERCGDNCAYFAYYLAKHHPNYNLYWVFKNKSIIKDLPQGVTALEMDSKECVNILKKAGLVFVCHGMADLTSTFSLYYSGALVVNFFHFGIDNSTESKQKYDCSGRNSENYFKKDRNSEFFHTRPHLSKDSETNLKIKL